MVRAQSVETTFGPKEALRAEMRHRLAALTAEERLAGTRRVLRRIAAFPAWREASRVLLFASLPVEPDLDLFWGADSLTGKQCAYPRVEGESLKLYYVDGAHELKRTRWGLREPPPHAARETALADFDLVLVPGLAFDASGGRLGRGGGYYDRLLAGRDPAKTRLIGVGFAFQRVEGTLPLAAHDVRLDEVITD